MVWTVLCNKCIGFISVLKLKRNLFFLLIFRYKILIRRPPLITQSRIKGKIVIDSNLMDFWYRFTIKAHFLLIFTRKKPKTPRKRLTTSPELFGFYQFCKRLIISSNIFKIFNLFGHFWLKILLRFLDFILLFIEKPFYQSIVAASKRAIRSHRWIETSHIKAY